VFDERPHRAENASTALPRRVRGWLGLAADPPLPRPRAKRLEPVSRSWAAAFWQARVSVRAGVLLDDYLRARLARYLAGLPVPRSGLPMSVEVEDGAIAVRPAEPSRRDAAPRDEGHDAWLAPLVDVEGPAVRQEANELEIRLSILEGEIDAARKRAEELSRRLDADVAAGLVAAPPGVEATAEQMGRPTVRSAAPHVLLGAFAAACVAAETWQVAVPLLAAAGVDAGRLGAEWAARPLETTFALLFALGVSAGLFALAAGGHSAATTVYRGEVDARRGRWLAASGLAAATLAGLMAAALAGIRGAHSVTPAWTYVLLLLAVPLATALILRAAKRESGRRRDELVAALQWDRARAQALADRARRLDELGWAEDEVGVLDRQRDAARRRLRELSARAVAAAHLATDAVQRERAALSRLAQSLIGALELDRYEFIRQASGRGATELLVPRRRKATDARSDMAAAPTAPLGTVAVEAGRLAS
jgi:hypothetical protein